MSRKLMILGTAAVFGIAAAVVAIGNSSHAVACDESAKSASVQKADASSCCAKDASAAKTADVKKVHNAMIKSAMVAPGAAPILNVAAFGGAMTAGNASCDWCVPAATAASACTKDGAQAYTAGAACVKDASSASVAAGAGCDKGAAVNASLASSGCDKSAKTASVAAGAGCDKGAAVNASLASSGCDKGSATTVAAGAACEKSSVSNASTLAMGGGSCCESKSAKTAGSGASCESDAAAAKTAEIKKVTDELPYREDKRLVLAGTYACGSCTMNATSECAPMFKTTDGKVYAMVKSPRVAEMRNAAKTDANVQVSAVVKKIDGVKYLEVKSYKVL